MCGRLRVGKDFLHVLQHWSVQPCVRPFDAVHMTAGHNALRGSGPDQTPNRGSLNCSHSRGTLVPVEEPSTASNSEVSLPERHVRCTLRSRRRQAAPGMSPWCQQPTFDISSSFASRNHVAHALVDCLLYSQQAAASTDHQGWSSPPSRRECKARTGHLRAARCSPCLRPAIWRGVQRQRTVLTLNIPFAGNVGSILPLSSRGSV